MEAGKSPTAWQDRNEPSEAGPETAVAATVDEAPGRGRSEAERTSLRHVIGSGIYPGDNGKTVKDFEQRCDTVIFAVEKSHSW